MQEVVKLWGRKFSEAWTACLLCMVQGDLTVVSLSHAITASKTGATAATAYASLMWVGKADSRWLGAWLTGVLVSISDIIVHPTHFGPEWFEALCTGAAAVVICVVWDLTGKRNA